MFASYTESGCTVSAHRVILSSVNTHHCLLVTLTSWTYWLFFRLLMIS